MTQEQDTALLELRERQVRSRLGAQPYYLGAATIDHWLDRHGPTAILAAVERMDRTEGDGKVIGNHAQYLEAVLSDDRPKRKRGGHGPDGPAPPLVPFQRRWEETLEDCGGDRAKAARIIVSIALAPLAVREPDTYEPNECERVYARCEDKGCDADGRPTGLWVVPRDELLQTLRAGGLPQWADWFERVTQAQEV